MTAPTALAQLAQLHTLIRDLVAQAPASIIFACPVPEQPSLAWYLGRCVYRELYWLREVLIGDDDLSARVQRIFTSDAAPLDWQLTQLPPPPDLLAWAAEIHDEHLRRLATPNALPAHPLLNDDRLIWWLIQEHAKDFERMLGLQLAWRCQHDAPDYHVDTPLVAALPLHINTVTIEQGHYRVGSHYELMAYDNELPPQAVELSAYRIMTTPITNAQYLAFIDADGYHETRWWAIKHEWIAPVHWRRDNNGYWYGVGLNGAADLMADAPVRGISPHEASAFTNWISTTQPAFTGAVLPHEYQWEVAARFGKLELIGRVWECCANPVHPYPEYQPVLANEYTSITAFNSNWRTIKGASLHTQPCLRRVSLRHWVAEQERYGAVLGLRLVLPPVQITSVPH